MQAVSNTVVVPVGGWLRRLGWLGTGSAAALAAWLVAARTALDLAGPRPTAVLVGSEALGAAAELGGHAEQAFRLSLVVLWLAAPLAVVTGGFRYASPAGQVAVLAVGLAGLGGAFPVLAVLGVAAANATLWLLAVVAGAILLASLFLSLVLRILTAPFRR